MAAGDRGEPLGTIDLACFCLFLGVVTTCVFYRYGIDNQVAELPLVLRAIDPGYLPHDFYTNAASSFGPRSNFTRALAAVATRETLPLVCFWLTAACNVAVAFVTALTARDLFGGSAAAGMSAAALALGVSTFRLGYTPVLFVTQLLASRAAAPLLLLALWAGLRQRALLCAASASAAAWLHPSFGLEGGALALGVLALASDPPRPAALLGAGLLFAGCAVVVLYPYALQVGPDPDAFVAVETRFRHPHHSLPSHFSASDWVYALAFLLAASLAAGQWRARAEAPRALPRALAALAAALILFCVVGGVFVELAPSKAWALARPFRLLLLAKWLGLVLIGGVAAVRLRDGGPRGLRGAPGLALAVVAALALAASHRLGSLLCLLAAGLAGLAWLRLPAVLARAATAAAAAALLANVFWGADRLPGPLARAGARLRPALTLDGGARPELDVARWARANTPAEAVFLTPPDLGVFRLAAERALVVDFKAFPFQADAMLEWRRRLADSYGDTDAAGWEALRELGERYRRIDADRLARVRDRYGASYAVVPRTAPNAAPVVYENARYKVLKLR